jgi:small subunit ribosomal protein S3
VGQKIHPTGFRIGVNKEHTSTWFANYGAYSKVLKEDYLIRQFFEKEFESIYPKLVFLSLK